MQTNTTNSSLTLSLRAHKLDNKDFFSKSDPYLVISKPVNGGWTPIRTSETIKNDLNPAWRPFLLYQQELPQHSDRLKFEVFDDDGKFGKDTSDESIGTGLYTLLELENAYKNQSLLPIKSKIFGRKSGSLMVTEFRISQEAPSQAVSGYPPVKNNSLEQQQMSSSVYSSNTTFAGGFVLPGRN